MAWLGLVSVTASAWAQIPPGFEVVRLTSVNDVRIHSRPSIANDGTVAWASAIPPFDSEVFLFRGGVIRRVNAEYYDVNPTVNSAGTTLVWMRGPDWNPPFDVVFRVADDATIRTIPGALPTFESAWANDLNHFVWTHDFSGDVTHTELFFFDGQTIQQISNNGVSNQLPRVNNSDWITWVRTDFNVDPFVDTIMLYRNGETLELTPGPGVRVPVDLNELGQLVWWEQDTGIVLWQDGQTTIVFEDGLEPYINNCASIFFLRWNAPAEYYDHWLLVDGTEYRLPHAGFGALGGDLNDANEAAWRVWTNDFGDTGILMLRKAGSKGDNDNDCHMTLRDFQAFQVCWTGPDAAPSEGLLGSCGRSDFDDDGDVDGTDLTAFLGGMTGPAGALPLCLP